MGRRPSARLRVALPILLVLIFSAPALGQQPARPRSHTDAVEAVAAVIAREHFDPDLAARIAHALRTRSSEGRYDAADTWSSLAQLLTRDLFGLSQDKHFGVRVVRDRAHAGTASAAENREVGARRTNYGVQRVEVLAGNVGYLNLTFFYRPEEATDALTAAMRVLRSADALIVDMRSNGGGAPDTVAWLLSYFFDRANLPLFDIVPRGGNGRNYATSAVAMAGRNEARPTYVLTARQTFSGGEGFAYILQERRRALVIGERTAGAANAGRFYPAGDFLEVNVPNGQVRTAGTGRNWEGRGVTPDVPAPASDALRVAHVHALRGLIRGLPDGPWRETLRRELTRLEQLADRR